MMSTMQSVKTDEKPRAWVNDIKPVVTKERAQQGIVEIMLDAEQSVKLVGVVYGLEHTISGEGFKARLMLDHYSQRIKIMSYEASNLQALILRVRALAEANGFDKITCMAPRRDWRTFLRFGYILEAVLANYLAGEDAYIVSKFRSQERLTSHRLMEEILFIEKVMETPNDAPARPLPENHHIRLARHEDIPALIELYGAIFESYPSPLVHASYLETVFQKETIFAVCTEGDTIVAAASAELAEEHRAAELTDCATQPEARGRGLMTHLLAFLEDELDSRNFICAYTMARARSFGMNNVFYRLGYLFSGRLVNNCDIYGAYEDMNIWVKDLRRRNSDSQNPPPRVG